MENLNEREVHPVVHPEDGDRRQVWSVHAVDGEEDNNEAKEGPAHYVARVTLQSDQVPPISSCWEKERSELNPNYLPGQIVSRTLFLGENLSFMIYGSMTEFNQQGIIFAKQIISI